MGITIRHLFCSHFMSALAALSAIATLIAFIFNWNTNYFPEYVSFSLLIVILLICCWYAHFQTKKKEEIMLAIHPKLNIRIAHGSLFNCKGMLVIPVNEYFDTIVDDEIIARKTVHGTFINTYFYNRINELDKKISSSLKGKAFIYDDKRIIGKKKKYPLGTCAEVYDGENAYILLAFTHFDKDNHAYVETTEIKEIICALCKYVEVHANCRPIYMPLIGTGQSGIRKSAQRILLFILDCIEFMCPISLPSGLHIIINQPTFTKLDLFQIEKIYKVLN